MGIFIWSFFWTFDHQIILPLDFSELIAHPLTPRIPIGTQLPLTSLGDRLPMNEFKHSYHQRDVRDFITETRLKVSEYSFNQAQQDSIDSRLEELLAMVEKADEFEKNNLAEYTLILHQLIIEKSKCFLFIDDLIINEKTRKK